MNHALPRIPQLIFLRPLVWVVAIVALGLPSVSRSEAAATVRPLYALCGAYPPEMAALKKEFGIGGDGWVRSSIKGIEFWKGRYQDKDVVVFRTGISLVNAAYQLQLAFDHFPVTHVLFAGVAGGTDPDLHVGDVVIPERWAYHSEAAYLNDDGKGGFHIPDYLKPKYENFGMIFPDDVAAIREGDADFKEVSAFAADPGLLEASRRAVPKLPAQRKAGRDITVSIGGTGVAGPVFLDNARYREWVFRVWRARCLDMESTALAHVAYANRKPVLIIRGLSDLAGGQQGKNPIDSNEARVSEIAVRVLRGVLDEL